MATARPTSAPRETVDSRPAAHRTTHPSATSRAGSAVPRAAASAAAMAVAMIRISPSSLALMPEPSSRSAAPPPVTIPIATEISAPAMNAQNSQRTWRASRTAT